MSIRGTVLAAIVIVAAAARLEAAETPRRTENVGGAENRKHHDWNVEGAQNIWIAVLGPDTPPLGERKDTPRVRQSQIAATAAALLGRDWRSANPKAAPPLPDVTRP